MRELRMYVSLDIWDRYYWCKENISSRIHYLDLSLVAAGLTNVLWLNISVNQIALLMQILKTQ